MNVIYRRLKEYLFENENINFDGVDVWGPGRRGEEWSTKYVEKILDDGTFYVGEETIKGSPLFYNFTMVRDYVNYLSEKELDKPITFIIDNVKWKMFTQERIFFNVVYPRSIAQRVFKTNSCIMLNIGVLPPACVRV